MTWENKKIIINGEAINALSPIIISASRATDLPAFYADWFVKSLEMGYCEWKNPFNGKIHYISLQEVQMAVFWSKFPKNIFQHLNFIETKIPNFYFQYTLNDYDAEKIEKNVPNLDARIKAFKELSNLIGKDRVIWRFDPLILGGNLDIKTLLLRIENIANQLVGYTEKLVFSFLDLYEKTRRNLQNENIKFVDWNEEQMSEFAMKLAQMNSQKWNFKLATCSEKIDFSEFGISHNKCVDDELILQILAKKYEKTGGKFEKLVNFLGFKYTQNLFGEVFEKTKYKDLKDKGQRTECGCIMSKDIGFYNSCPFGCVYCYANVSPNSAMQNYKKIQTENGF